MVSMASSTHLYRTYTIGGCAILDVKVHIMTRLHLGNQIGDIDQLDSLVELSDTTQTTTTSGKSFITVVVAFYFPKW